MEIKEKIEEIVEKVKNDKDFDKNFKEDPVKALEELLGTDLPDEQVKAVIEGVKAKVNLDELGDKAGDLLGGAVDKLKGLFGGKKVEPSKRRGGKPLLFSCSIPPLGGERQRKTPSRMGRGYCSIILRRRTPRIRGSPPQKAWGRCPASGSSPPPPP